MQAQLTFGFSVILPCGIPERGKEGQILGDRINVWVCVGKEGGRKEEGDCRSVREREGGGRKEVNCVSVRERGGGILGDSLNVWMCVAKEGRRREMV